jgi:hypothetical protein
MASAVARADISHLKPAELVDQTTCRIVESAAHLVHFPIDLLTRLVWVESHFHASAVSSAGAQGIAQFMPTTAAERGLADPFDPEQAIPKAAELLADLYLRFGNLGLAIAAYNAGPSRVSNWLAGVGNLPAQTQAYVLTLTGRGIGDWLLDKRDAARANEPDSRRSCLEITASLRAKEGGDRPLAPAWGVGFGANFLKSIGLASFERARQRYCGKFSHTQPLIAGAFLLGSNARSFRRARNTASQLDTVAIRDLTVPSLCTSLFAQGRAAP